MSTRTAPGGRRMLCVGRGERCFACGGRGDLGPRRIEAGLGAVRLCPVCQGRGRARVVGLGDGR